MRESKPATTLVFVALLAACGQEAVSPPGNFPNHTDLFTVSVTVHADTVSPGDTVAVSVTVSAIDSTVVIQEFVLRVRGPLFANIVLGRNITGSQREEILLTVPTGPSEGYLRCGAYVRLLQGDVTAADSARVVDRHPPVVHPPEQLPIGVEPGWTQGIGWSASDNGLLTKVVPVTTGAVERIDTTLVGSTVVHRVDSIAVPANASIGDSIFVRLIAIDHKGYRDSVMFPIPVRDMVPPLVSAQLAPPPGDGAIAGDPVWVTGDTMDLTVALEDEYALGELRWQLLIGGEIEIGSGAKAATGRSDILHVPIEIEPGWNSFPAVLRIRGVDSTGNERLVDMYVHLFDGRRRPHRVVENNYIGLVSEVVYDPDRQLLYMIAADSIVVLDVAAATFSRSFRLPGRPIDIDLLPGGDTLVALITDSTYLVVADLTTNPPGLHQRQLDLETSQRPTGLAAAANRKVFIAAARGLVIDFTTDEMRKLPEFIGGARVYHSKDRSVVLRHDQWGIVYRTATDTVEQYYWISMTAPPDIDRDGNLLLSREHVYDTKFELRNTLVPESSIIWGYAMADDGASAFYTIGEDYSVRRLGVEDGHLMERILMPFASRLIAPTGGQYLFVWSGDGAPRYIVDLSVP